MSKNDAQFPYGERGCWDQQLHHHGGNLGRGRSGSVPPGGRPPSSDLSSLEFAALYGGHGAGGGYLPPPHLPDHHHHVDIGDGTGAPPPYDPRRKSHSSIVDACMADLMSRRRMAMAREAAAAAAAAASAAREAAASVASLEGVGPSPHPYHQYQLRYQFQDVAGYGGHPGGGYAASCSPGGGGRWPPAAHYNHPHPPPHIGGDDRELLTSVIREKEERIRALREEQERRVKAKQQAAEASSAGGQGGGDSEGGGRASATPSSARPTSSSAPPPDGWWVCEVCKTRAFASEGEALKHQATCSEKRSGRGDDGQGRGLEQRSDHPSQASAPDPPPLPPNSAGKTTFSTGGSARTAVASRAAAQNAALQNLKLTDVTRLAMQEMARRGLAGQQQQEQQQQQEHLGRGPADSGEVSDSSPDKAAGGCPSPARKPSDGAALEPGRKEGQETAPAGRTTGSVAAATGGTANATPSQEFGRRGDAAAADRNEDGDGEYAAMPSPIPLGIPLDKDMLTPLHCFVREHCVQVFTATKADVDAPSKGKRRQILVGQVGIRCPHCRGGMVQHAAAGAAHNHRRQLPLQQQIQLGLGSGMHHGNSTGTERGSVYYPFTVASIYNATMNLLQRHLQYCPCVPPWIMDRYRDLKSDDARSGTSKQYWMDSARKLGLVDTADGIRYDPALVERGTSASGRSNDFYSNRSNALPTAPAVGARHQQQHHHHGGIDPVAGYRGADVMLRDRGVGVPYHLLQYHRAEAAAAAHAHHAHARHPHSRPTPEQTLEVTAASGSERLVVPEDEALATSFSYHIMSQMQKCHFTEADRLGKRKALPLGFEGLACRHCFGGFGTGRFFPSTIKTLSDTSKTLNVLHNHMMRCRKCPPEVRDSLEKLKGRHDAERARMKFGSQKVFFERIWARLHPNNAASRTKLVKQQQEEKQASPSAPSSPVSRADDPSAGVSSPPTSPAKEPTDNALVALALLAGMKRKDKPTDEGPISTKTADEGESKEGRPPTSTASAEQAAAALRKNIELHAATDEHAAKRAKVSLAGETT